MTLDDLVKIARAKHDTDHDAIKAVVAALRDEMNYLEDMTVLDEILGSDAVVKAGGPTSNDGQQDNGLTAPARPKPAAEICEWRATNDWWNRSCDGLDVGFFAKPDNTVCGKCLRPISFMEAATDE